MGRKVAIVIVTYNKLDYNISCIESIRKHTKNINYEIIVVDNNSTDGTRQWLLEQSDLKVVLSDNNDGFIGGCNAGFKAAESDCDIMLLNNDIVVTPYWMDNLVECLYSDENIGIVGPMTNVTIQEQRVQISYNNMSDMEKFAEEYNTTRGRDWEEKTFLMGFCLLIKREIFEKAGLYLDPLYSPGYCEDNDLLLRINKQRYKAYLCRNTFIHHYGSVSFQEVEGIETLRRGSMNKFLNKWGIGPDENLEIKTDLISQVFEPSQKELNILEVNCGIGADLLKLKYFFPKAQLYGVEKNIRLASIGENYINMSTSNINDLMMKHPGVQFDYVILRDIYVDSEDIETLIKEYKLYLKSSGYMIVAVRNILHFLVIRDFINGNIAGDSLMNYSKFYTSEQLKNIFKANGFNVAVLKPSIIYGSEDDHRFIHSMSQYSVDKSAEKYLTYTYIGKFIKAE